MFSKNLINVSNRVLVKCGFETSTDTKVNAGIAGVGMSAPFMGLIGQKAVTEDPYTNSNIKRMSSKELAQMARPGDVVMTSSRNSWGNLIKEPQSISSGTEFYHSEPVISMGDTGPVSTEAGRFNPRSRRGTYKDDTVESILEGKKGTPLASRIDTGGSASFEDAVLLRLKKDMTPEQLEDYRKQLAAGGRQRYSKHLSHRAFLEDIFLPKIKGLTDRIPQVTPDCKGETCSSLPAVAYEKATGNVISPGKASKVTLPTDLLRADSPYEAIGAALGNPQAQSSAKVRLLKRLALRGGIGAGIAGTGLLAYNEPEALVGMAAGAAAPVGLRALGRHIQGKQTATMREGSLPRKAYESLQGKLVSRGGVDEILPSVGPAYHNLRVEKTTQDYLKRNSGRKYLRPEATQKMFKNLAKNTGGIAAGASLGTYGLLKGLRYLNRDKEEQPT